MAYFIDEYPVTLTYQVFTPNFYSDYPSRAAVLDYALIKQRRENQVRREILENDLNQLRRSRIEADIITKRIQEETALRRSRVETKFTLSRIQADNALARSRLNYQIQSLETQSVIANSRISNQLATQKAETQLLRESIRKLRQAQEYSIIRGLQDDTMYNLYI